MLQIIFYILAALFFCILLFFLLIIWAPGLRQQLLTRHLLCWAKAKTPKLSVAEQEVLQHGDVGWEQQLFSGKPDWALLAHVTELTLSVAEQAFLTNQVEHLCELLDQQQFVDHDSDLPICVWDYLKQERFWGLTIPQEYGGHGFTDAAHAAIITRLATRSYSVAITVMVPNSVGPAELIQHYGRSEQKNYYLPRLACSEEIPCFALTSNEAGSDATSIIDHGVVCWGEWQKERVLGIRLHWDKRYITLAPIATLIALAFKLYDPDHLLGTQENIGITLALIPANCPGVNLGQRHQPLHLAFMNGPISGDNVFIPVDNVIGGRDGCGAGWRMILARFAIGRGISLPALTNGAAQIAVATTSAYALVRQQFHSAIGQFESVQLKLAQIAGFAYLNQAMQQLLLQQITAGKTPAVASAIAKYHLTELNRELINAAMDVHGGRGIQLGPRNYLADFYFSAPINITVEGANLLTRNLIILSQGMVSGHQYLQKELKALQCQDSQQQLRQFDQVIWSHLSQMISLGLRVTYYGLTGGRLIMAKSTLGPIAWQQQLTRMSAAFAFITDLTLVILGKKLKTHEAISARLGDVLSYLYLASAVMQYSFSRRDHVAEQQLAKWCVQYCLAKIQQALDELLNNFPKKYWGKILRKIIFPTGKAYFESTDQLGFTIATSLLQNSSLRQCLLQNCFMGQKSASYRVQAAMYSVLQAAPIVAKLEQANLFINKLAYSELDALKQILQDAITQEILTFEECTAVQEMFRLCQEAIMVDVM